MPIHVLSEGCSEQKPILLVHATGFHGRTYQSLATHLCERTSAPILAPDLRGHGDATTPKSGRYSWDGFAEDLIAVVDAIGQTGLVAFGHSMGGATLLRVEQLRPGTFSNLYLYEPIVFPSDFRSDDADSPLVEASRRRRHRFPSFEAAIERFASKPPLEALDRQCLTDYVLHGFEPTVDGDVQLKLPGTEEAEIYRLSLSVDIWAGLPQVESSVTVGYGRITGHSAAAVAPKIAERLKHCITQQYSDLGHFGPLESPARIAADIRLMD